ncbi:RNA-binding domain-containing protein [Methanocaldococcus infernus]
MEIYIKSKVKPTEDKNKVRRAILNIFPHAKLVFKDNYWEGTCRDVETLKQRLRKQAILDTARAILEENVKGDTVTFYLNKQAAYVKAINFDIDTHGGIFVKIKDEEIMKVIKDIAPRTKGGVIIEEEELEQEEQEETQKEEQ